MEDRTLYTLCSRITGMNPKASCGALNPPICRIVETPIPLRFAFGMGVSTIIFIKLQYRLQRCIIVLNSVGSAGDVVPFQALAVKLKRAGHQVKMLPDEIYRNVIMQWLIDVSLMCETSFIIKRDETKR
jgi:Glycosyltransferase family 28 N-terminal domain.